MVMLQQQLRTQQSARVRVTLSTCECQLAAHLERRPPEGFSLGVTREEGRRTTQRRRNACANCVAARPEQQSVQQRYSHRPHNEHRVRCSARRLVLFGIARHCQGGAQVSPHLILAVLERLAQESPEDACRGAWHHKERQPHSANGSTRCSPATMIAPAPRWKRSLVCRALTSSQITKPTANMKRKAAGQVDPIHMRML
eukprot:1124113-Prymnesium_polylepis.1